MAVTDLLCNLEWLFALGPGTEGSAALGDGSLHQPFIVRGEDLQHKNISKTITGNVRGIIFNPRNEPKVRILNHNHVEVS